MSHVQEMDALKLLGGLETDSVDVAIIAPPNTMNPMPTFRALSRVLKPRGVAWYLTEDDYNGPTIAGFPWRRALLIDAMQDWDLLMDCIVLKTTTNHDAHRRPQPLHDYVFMFAQSPDYRYFVLDSGVNHTSVWKINNSTQDHPEYPYFQNPELLIDILIRMTCPKDGVVLDPFMGTGTTAVVAERLGRQWIGGDCDAAACEIAERRISNG